MTLRISAALAFSLYFASSGAALAESFGNDKCHYYARGLGSAALPEVLEHNPEATGIMICRLISTGAVSDAAWMYSFGSSANKPIYRIDVRDTDFLSKTLLFSARTDQNAVKDQSTYAFFCGQSDDCAAGGEISGAMIRVEDPNRIGMYLSFFDFIEKSASFGMNPLNLENSVYELFERFPDSLKLVGVRAYGNDQGADTVRFGIEVPGEEGVWNLKFEFGASSLSVSESDFFE